MPQLRRTKPNDTVQHSLKKQTTESQQAYGYQQTGKSAALGPAAKWQNFGEVVDIAGTEQDSR